MCCSNVLSQLWVLLVLLYANPLKKKKSIRLVLSRINIYVNECGGNWWVIDIDSSIVFFLLRPNKTNYTLLKSFTPKIYKGLISVFTHKQKWWSLEIRSLYRTEKFKKKFFKRRMLSFVRHCFRLLIAWGWLMVMWQKKCTF